jgi:hypothetical protein
VDTAFIPNKYERVKNNKNFLLEPEKVAGMFSIHVNTNLPPFSKVILVKHLFTKKLLLKTDKCTHCRAIKMACVKLEKTKSFIPWPISYTPTHWDRLVQYMCKEP